MRRIIKMSAVLQAQRVKLLLEGTYTCQELADETGLHYVTVLQYTRELHRAKAAYISAWEKDVRGRDAIKIYKIGVGKDVKREKLTGAQRQAKARERRRAAALARVTAGTARLVPSANGRLRVETVA